VDLARGLGRCSSSAETPGIAPGAKVGLASPVPARP
jgi:hypothetical protein